MRALVGGLVIAVAAPGCNQAFDLRPTEVVDSPTIAPPDLDKDGTLDEADNCPSAANVDQADRDGDGFGDACDACGAISTTINHDEDGDFHGDECDVCPAVPDFQDDTDQNGIGNVCGAFVSPGPARRLLFDPFVTLDPSRWRTSSTPWEARGDAVSPSSILSTAESGLELIEPPVMGTKWRLTVGFATPRRWAAGDRFGIVMTDATSGAPFLSCLITCTASGCVETLTTTLGMESANVLAKPIASMFIEFNEYGTNPDVARCGEGNLDYVVTEAMMPSQAKVYVLAMPDIPTSFIDILE